MKISFSIRFKGKNVPRTGEIKSSWPNRERVADLKCTNFKVFVADCRESVMHSGSDARSNRVFY